MAETPKARTAHYHAIKASQAWKEFVAAMDALATNTPDERAEKDRERERETTYARGELGGS